MILKQQDEIKKEKVNVKSIIMRTKPKLRLVANLSTCDQGRCFSSD